MVEVVTTPKPRPIGTLTPDQIVTHTPHKILPAQVVGFVRQSIVTTKRRINRCGLTRRMSILRVCRPGS